MDKVVNILILLFAIYYLCAPLELYSIASSLKKIVKLLEENKESGKDAR